jgi:hypothetical protein
VFPAVYLLETGASNRLLIGIKPNADGQPRRPSRAQLIEAARTVRLLESFPTPIDEFVERDLVDVSVPRLSALPFLDADL